ncbi:NAD(P)H-binding protein [Actinospica durhamensis]|uniref:NAD(P)H-binding protein n=1 Tax=Actinospica durhamensis TaxID=1508375 RepID=A0A941IMI6_9ACTN|nr:NAD(P)H-binding protein [Actinospica durhamensis]MBR7832904.1 NAD(P)H-binding protein [Actinospica durhamensis]
MRIAVLGASGNVGGLLVEQAAERGHEVVALVRRPDRFTAPAAGKIEVRQADVRAPHAFPDLGDVEVVVSAIGISKGDGPGALIAGARVLADTRIRTLWLGALGSGASTGAGGKVYHVLMRMFVGKELAEKAEADGIALAAGATVVHAPDLGKGPISPKRGVARLADYRRTGLLPRISAATVAAVMLDEAENGAYGAEIVVPLG